MPRDGFACECCHVARVSVNVKSFDDIRGPHLCEACRPAWEYVREPCDHSWPCKCSGMKKIRRCSHGKPQL